MVEIVTDITEQDTTKKETEIKGEKKQNYLLINLVV